MKSFYQTFLGSQRLPLYSTNGFAHRTPGPLVETATFLLVQKNHEPKGPRWPNHWYPQNGWFIMENHFKMDDFGGTTIFGNFHLGSRTILIGFSCFVCAVHVSTG